MIVEVFLEYGNLIQKLKNSFLKPIKSRLERYTFQARSTDPASLKRQKISPLKIDAQLESSLQSYKQTSNMILRALTTQTLKSFHSHSTFKSRTKKLIFQMIEVTMDQTSSASMVHQIGYQTITKKLISDALKDSQRPSKSHSPSRRHRM